ncbi:Bug family tripartite tricarboxylate transporter substrate binding protein [Ottowia thiooxydans]|uniref:Tripartite-type tricarboxylate transporter receptor subunit TctC n=1 Tax=Ottowia thiooxydans TaxID=219182 RepID=A0ABV2QA18_9BURK
MSGKNNEFEQGFMQKRSTLFKVLLGAAITVSGSVALANEPNYPAKPVRMIVSYAAGNVTDTLARIVGDGLAARWGQPVTIENKPGSGGSLGAQVAVKTPPDGYTLLVSAMAAMAINPHVYSNVGYDVRKDFVPVVSMAYPDMIMVLTPGLKIDSLAKLVEFGKANPAALNYGTAGNGTVPHLNMEQLKARSGLVAQHVPYKAAAAVLTDLIGGRVQIQQEASSVLLPQVKAGKVIPVAVGSQVRSKQLPDVPTLSELYPGFEPVTPWLGIFAPAGTSPAIVEKINRDVREILSRPAIQKQLSDNGLTVSDGPQKQFEATVRKDYDRLGALVQKMNLKVD